MIRIAFILLMILAGCEAKPAPRSQPFKSYGGLPITGTLADAHKAGFTRCVELTTGLRCRRNGVMLQGQGPYAAGLDLAKHDGSGGFTELTLWHDDDQNAVFAVGDELERYGWRHCLTGGDKAGDQKIWTRNGAPVRFSMDISYWGKRRLRVIPEDGRSPPPCPARG